MGVVGGWGGAARGTPHSSGLGLWQAALPLWPGRCGGCWQRFHPRPARINGAGGGTADTLALTGTGKRSTVLLLYPHLKGVASVFPQRQGGRCLFVCLKIVPQK